MTIELQEKIPYIEPVHGVKLVIAQNLTSEMTEAGVEGLAGSSPSPPTVYVRFLRITRIFHGRGEGG